MQVPLTNADLATAGTHTVVVINQNDGQKSNSVNFVVGAANPAPTITTLSPAGAATGGAAFTLTVNGTNFVSGSVVQWNGSNRTTTFVSATQVTAAITQADIATAGTAQITVFNPAPGGGTSAAVSFTIGAANPVPTLTALSPTSALAGGVSFTLSVTGTNFVSGSLLQWNKSSRATTVISATQLTAVITAADIATVGTASITVFNPAPGGGTSSALNFAIQTPNPVPTLTALTPSSVTVGGITFNLIVTGTNFLSTSQVLWNGSAVPTAFNSATSLQATIDQGLIKVPYTAQISVSNPAPGGGTSTSLPLPINPTAAAQLDLEPQGLNFTAQAGTPAPPAQVLRIGNSGGGTLSWTATFPASATWLTLSAASGSATVSAPSQVQVKADPTGLKAGFYSAIITVTPTGGTAAPVQVNFNVTAQPAVLNVGQTGLRLAAVSGTAGIPSQKFAILNSGQGVMNWSVQTSGGSWLSVTPSSGSSSAGSAAPFVTVSADPSKVTAAGTYYGTITVTGTGASNSPQTVSVVFNVLPQTSLPAALSQDGIILVGTAGGAVSTLNLTATSYAFTGATLGFSPGTYGGGNWLALSPSTVTLASAGQSATVAVTGDPSKLAAGTYYGYIGVLDTSGLFSGNVTVAFLVLPAASAYPQSVGGGAITCTPKNLIAVLQLSGGGLGSAVGWPRSLQLQAIDDCASPATNATAVATFSNGDPPLVLTNLGGGLYSGTWKPGLSADNSTVTTRVNQAGLTEAVLQISGKVAANPGVPLVSSGGVVNGASFAKAQPVAPGSIVSVFGQSIAANTPGGATSLPLPTTLAGATVTVGGTAAPLYYSSSGQINAQIPVELTANNNLPLLIQLSQGTATAISIPESVALDVARPGIFLAAPPATQGVIVNVKNQLVDSTAPATAGDVLVIYCTGLGATTPPAVTGQASPGNPPGTVNIQPTVTIGGVAAGVQFAGLTPGLVGLYQVNVQVPTGVTAGSSVPVIITQNGVASNTVTIVVK